MGNGNQNESGNERRLLLAIVLSMAVLFLTPYLYRWFFPSLAPKPEPKPEVSIKAPPADFEKSATPLAEPLSAVSLSATSAQPQVIEIENSELILRWNSVGAVLESAVLKNYLVRVDEPTSAEEKWIPRRLQMIPQGLPKTFPRVLAVRVADSAVQRKLDYAIYEVVGASGKRMKAPAQITFSYSDGKIQAVKRVVVPAAGYSLEVTAETRNDGQRLPSSVFLGPGIGDLDPSSMDDFRDPRLVHYASGKVIRYSADDLEEGAQTLEVDARWAGLETHYFSYLVLSPNGIRSLRLNRSLWKWKDPKGQEQQTPLLSAEVGLRDSRFVFFAGPKDGGILQSVDGTLNDLINYGWFAFLVWPLLVSLKFIHQYIHNYGWAIIILTFIINLALFPLRYKQMVSMKKMADLQPKLKSIQEKYRRMKRTDPRRAQMNVEVSELYRLHGVNPLGGCLPLLIQMPFLFAFYSMLASSIELRGAPFIGWIQDLSRYDPLYITPIVMGATMVIQQMMTPGGTADPTQRRMMMILPVVFTFMFLNLSSGLVLYFLFSNVFGMMFQYLFQKWNPELAPAKPSKKVSESKKQS